MKHLEMHSDPVAMTTAASKGFAVLCIGYDPTEKIAPALGMVTAINNDGSPAEVLVDPMFLSFN